jgi:RNA polymerase sigma factor (sigma-70 family)
MVDETTRELLDRVSRGDRRAIDDLLVEHLQPLHAFVRLRAGDALAGRESTVDLVQSVCRELLANAGDYTYRGEAAFKNWLFTAATNKIVDRNRFHRRARRDVGREARVGDDATDLLESYATLATPSRVLMGREQAERIEVAFGKLLPQYREVITLSRIARLTHAEIAAETGRTEVAVRGLMARGMARLSALLAESE